MPVVRFVGSKAQGLAVARALSAEGTPWRTEIVTLDDRHDARSVLDAFVALAAERHVPCTVVASRADARALLCTPVDVQVVVGWYWMMSAEERGSARCGTVGVHNSLLPHYRGGAPLTWSMINGDPVVGATLFTLGHGMDDGDVWAQVSLAVGGDERIGEVLARLEPAATEMIMQALPGMLDGSCVPAPQDHARATYAAQRVPNDGVIDWQWPAQRIHDFVRAQSSPYPGAFTYLDGQRLTVWRTAVVGEQWHATPGQVIAIRAPTVHVACGDGRVLALLEVSVAGPRDVAAAIVRTRDTRFPPMPLLLDALRSEA
jgi:methionyl-tRNA formyltransferase